MTILVRDLIKRCSNSYPNEIAYWDGDRSLTWAQVDDRSDRFAAALKNLLRIEKGDTVAILSHEHLEAYEHLFACFKIGAPRVGINWKFQRENILHIIKDSNVKAILIQANCVDILKDDLDDMIESGIKVIGYGENHGLPFDYESLIETVCWSLKLPELEESDIIGYSYTSGTTGLSKGVILSQLGVYTSIINITLTFGLRFEDVWFPATSNAWITFVHGCLGLANGMPVVLLNGDFEPEKYLRLCEKYGATANVAVPTMVTKLLQVYKEGDYDLSDMRLMTFGSAPIHPSLLKEVMEVFDCEVNNNYGLTETTLGPATGIRTSEYLRAFENDLELQFSCGRPALHMEIEIRGESGTVLPAGEIGEVWIRSDSNMIGYLNMPELTSKTLVDGWLDTSDIGRVDKEGFLYLTDRKDYMIITGGINVFPSTVENVLIQHPDVSETSVVGLPHKVWGEAVFGTVVLVPGSEIKGEDLISYCKDKLPKWEIPKAIVIIDEIPKGPTGKIMKRETIEEYKYFFN